MSVPRSVVAFVGDGMGNIERNEWTILVCPECGDWHDRTAYRGCGVACKPVEVVCASTYQGAVEALREIANLPHSGADDSRAVAAERGRIAREALHRYGGQ
jgi:hypothetical protein